MQQQEIVTAVRAFLRENFLVDDEAGLGEDTSFMQTHTLDSTGFVELIGFVEETFGLEVRDEEMLPENFDSLANIAHYVARKHEPATAR
ncbi:MAG TPA: acyl carrier protein [Usitatibacter sp.]|jgi:acyl carrier protein|nr:acyl carrier protein [Usitatibacter sp.]